MPTSSVETPRQEGQIDVAPLFDFDVPDQEIAELLRRPIDDAVAFWNGKEFDLDNRRKKNKQLYLGEQRDLRRLYDHNADYRDNRIFISVETLISQVTARPPEPEVYPATDTPNSQQLAADISNVTIAYVEQYGVMRTFKTAMRHLFLYRVGALKLRFDPDFGPEGEVITEYVMPNDLVFDKDAKPGENPRFIAQYLEASVEELIARFPAKETEIRKECQVVRGTKRQMSSKHGYLEVWFTYIDPDNSSCEAVCWLLNKVVLDKMKTPNWNYSKSSELAENYLNYPLKPFIILNYLNLGEHIIDDTTMIEQAEPLQIILNKRGRQIVENADNTNGGWIFNSNMIDADSVKALTGSFDERILVDGPVNQAAARLPANVLPSYVIEDKFDARTEIDDIFGTHNLTRGQGFVNRTLGQAVMQQRQDMSRQDDLIRSFENMATRYYQYLLQMMKVYYTEDHLYRVVGDDGQFDFIAMHSDKIQDGVDIRVRTGTTLAMDKASVRDTAVQLAGMRMIDPQTLFEDLGLPNAKRRADRLMKYLSDPQGLEALEDQEEMDRDAFMDIQIINAGQQPPSRDDFSNEYVSYYKKYLMTGEFQALSEPVKAEHLKRLAEVVKYLQAQLQIMQSQLPTPEEIRAGQFQQQQEQEQLQKALSGAPRTGGTPSATPPPGLAGVYSSFPGIPGTPIKQV